MLDPFSLAIGCAVVGVGSWFGMGNSGSGSSDSDGSGTERLDPEVALKAAAVALAIEKAKNTTVAKMLKEAAKKLDDTNVNHLYEKKCLYALVLAVGIGFGAKFYFDRQRLQVEEQKRRQVTNYCAMSLWFVCVFLFLLSSFSYLLSL